MPEDKYVNTVFGEAVESGINTLTFKEINMGMSLFDKKAMLVQRLSWYRWPLQLIADGDKIQFGLCTSDSFSAVTAEERSIIHLHTVALIDYGVAANCVRIDEPIDDDFTSLKGNGLLIAPKPLFVFVKSQSAALVGVASVRIQFIFIDMKSDEYLELLESRQFFG